MIPTERQFDLLYSDYQQLDTPERFGQFIFNRTNFEITGSYNETDTQKAWDMLKKAIINHQLPRANGWIKCSDAMPSLHNHVIVLQSDACVLIDTLQFLKDGVAKWGNGEAVTHWMPLPNRPLN